MSAIYKVIFTALLIVGSVFASENASEKKYVSPISNLRTFRKAHPTVR